MVKSNQRHYLRENSGARIQVRLITNNFEGPEDNRDLIPAKMINKSDSGVNIKLDRYLETI